MVDITDRFVLIDTKTNEIVSSFSDLPSAKDSKGKGYFMLWNDIIHDTEVGNADKLLFLHLCTIMEPGGWIAETQSEIARQLDLDVSNVAKAMGRLMKRGYLCKTPHKGSLWFQINPLYAHRGPLIYRKIQR